MKKWTGVVAASLVIVGASGIVGCGGRDRPATAPSPLAASVVATATAAAVTPDEIREVGDRIGELARLRPVTQGAVDALVVAAASPHAEIRRAALNRFRTLARDADEVVLLQLRAAALGALRSDDEKVRLAAMNYFFASRLHATDPAVAKALRWHETEDSSDANRRRVRGELERAGEGGR